MPEKQQQIIYKTVKILMHNEHAKNKINTWV